MIISIIVIIILVSLLIIFKTDQFAMLIWKGDKLCRNIYHVMCNNMLFTLMLGFKSDYLYAPLQQDVLCVIYTWRI